jgi:hypothetical protein
LIPKRTFFSNVDKNKRNIVLLLKVNNQQPTIILMQENAITIPKCFYTFGNNSSCPYALNALTNDDLVVGGNSS